MMSHCSADHIQDAEGRQYHIGLARGEVEQRILTCGDPARAIRISKRFDEVRVSRVQREFTSFTGTFEGVPLTVMATGIGCDNTEIAVIELCQIVDDPIFIRVGTSGSLRPEVKVEDLVISTASCRLENTSTWFVPEGFPAVAHHEVVQALIHSAQDSDCRYHTGITATASGFYGAQGREGLGFPPADPDLPARLGELNVKNMEMETSTLFTLTAMRGFRAGAVCTIFANRCDNKFIAADRKIAAEDAAIDVALRALIAL